MNKKIAFNSQHNFYIPNFRNLFGFLRNEFCQPQCFIRRQHLGRADIDGSNAVRYAIRWTV